ncbi:TetR/AcrR family transcriptional regulator [Microtetraspora sp. NBRC 16547]|uniref:TetR/AcrR family transcriptional regulator n=1 Tax=Microtetraspora sp. NBRC 16547 TaxID=3030993 RepID=UPI0024A038D9|nr:TetR/AcrR family transcriptional regulator [Microtetraspora sp. NBRC 16547]GLW98236.1 hypothetical protein Misp02_23230 [Microtetraspora sp. NBRC 16547]
MPENSSDTSGNRRSGEGVDTLAARRRLQIISAASEVICRRGVDGARLKDIADEAGVSLGMLQHYFRHREALIDETISAMLELTLATWRSVQSHEPDPVRRLFALLRFQVAGWAPFEKRWAFWMEFWAVAHRDAKLGGHARDVYQRWGEPFRSTIDEGAKLGAFRPVFPIDRLVVLLMSLADGTAVRVLYEPESLDEEGMYALLVETACALLRIEEPVRDTALAALPQVISHNYPNEPIESEDIDWSPLIGLI